MRLRTIVLAGMVSSFCLGAPAFAESGGSPFTITVKNTASATQPEKKVEKKAEQKPGKSVPKVAKAEKNAAASRKKEKTVEVAVVTAPTELRSDTQERGLFSALFGGPPQMLPETQRRDQELRERELKKGKKFKVKADFQPQVVEFSNSYSRGTIVVNTSEKYLYLIESGGKARRYAIAVGKDGLKFKGTGKIQDKQEWPRWIPTKEMQERDPAKYGKYKDGMPGGPDNPLGARAMYLYQGKKDTHIRIHGTNQPWTIGTDSSNGCFRMVNEHVMDLYNRVRLGADVVVL
ncbi:MAG: L,D-transpeptidase [Mesorhizobium sp.]|nr:L,D-transpeptidase [Mesorhizobium sp.]MCO5163458.1 L,D-transpeptidase [Mesorhizobium sp.]